MDLAVFGLVLGPDEFGGLPPNHDFTVGRSDQILLVIYGAEEPVGEEADGENRCGLQIRQVDGVAAEVLDLEGVEVRKEGGVAEGKVEAKVVVTGDYVSA